VRARGRLELQNARSLKYEDNDFLSKCTLAFKNIIPCFSNNHSSCCTKSTVCQHHMAILDKYNTKHLPYGKHLQLNKQDKENIKATFLKILDVKTIKAMAELFNTNRCESLHCTIFNYAPKFTCWTKNFSGLCHSATHSRTLGTCIATVKLANAIGINVKKSSRMFLQLKRMDTKRMYHSTRQKTTEYKQSRYFMRKRVQHRTEFLDSLYSGVPSNLSKEHNYGVNC
jgi:hypothetical protein